MPTSLANRVALVTGGLRGIGRAAAQSLRDRGATVIIGDLPSPQASGIATECGLHYLQLDVTCEADWAKALAAITADHGRLDILVGNAGGDAPGKLADMTMDRWRSLMALNVDSVFWGIKTFQSLLAASGAQTPYGSSVINVSSILGLVGSASSAAYCTSKGAVRLMTKALALEFAGARIPIRVNSIHPGMVDTALLRDGSDHQAAQSGTDPDAAWAALAAAVPNGRLAQPAEIGRVIAFLASDDASYMTGSAVAVDGGWTAR